MFDKLVESTNQKQTGRNKFYLITSLIYGSSLSVLAVSTILWFNPGLAEANTISILLPPVPIAAPPPELAPVTKVQPDPGFIEPKTPPDKIMDATKVPPKPPQLNDRRIVMRAPVLNPGNGTERSLSQGSLGIGNEIEAPPPPRPTPTPKAEPTPTPTPKLPDIVRMTSTMITGKAVRKVQPPYPQIARAVRAEGAVPVQITISEEGRVLDATVVSGHPTLREAARQAALQWVFSPTVLSGKPVKVAGVISFNFMLN